MLRKIIECEVSQTILKILLKTQLAVIIEYPSYAILAYSDALSPEEIQLHKRFRDAKHDVTKFSQQMGEELKKFRENKVSSRWLLVFKRKLLSSLELFQMDDTPIFYNNQLVGICLTFKSITMESTSFLHQLINDKTSKPLSSVTKNNIYNTLSELEKEILFLASLGKSAKQVSSLLRQFKIRDIGHATINAVVSQRIYKKLNTETLDEAIAKGIESGEVDKIPESILLSLLKNYYLLSTKKDFINL